MTPLQPSQQLLRSKSTEITKDHFQKNHLELNDTHTHGFPLTCFSVGMFFLWHAFPLACFPLGMLFPCLNTFFWVAVGRTGELGLSGLEGDGKNKD